MRLDEAVYTVFDVETTGLFPYAGDRICEIGAVRMEPGSPKKIFHSLVDPGRPVSPRAFEVNGITKRMLDGKPTIEKILPEFLDFVEGSVLVAYNAGFDMGFVESALAREGERLGDFTVIDALKLARNLFPGIGRYSLSFVADSLGFPVDGQHRALGDAMLTVKVFEKELELLKNQGIEDLKDVSENMRTRKKPLTEDSVPVLAVIEDAIGEEGVLDITYRSYWNNKTTNRTITPREIRKGYDRSYVVAFCHMRKEMRNFRLECITEAVKKEGS